MKRLGIFCLGMFPLLLHSQTVALPTDSGWNIHHKGQTTKLDKQILYVSAFDQQGLATFVDPKSTGIVNVQGEVLFKTTGKLVALDKGCFYHNDSVLLLIKDNKITDQSLRKITVSKDWIIGSADSRLWAVNKNSKETIDFQIWNYGIFDGFLSVSAGGSERLYNRQGKFIDSTVLIQQNQLTTADSYCLRRSSEPQLLIWNTPRYKGIFHSDSHFLTPSATRLILTKSHVEIREKNQVHLYDLQQRKIVLSIAGESVIPSLSGFYQFSRNDKLGLLGSEGQVLLPAQFDKIDVFNQYILVRQGKFVGLYDKSFRKILDCKYTAIEPRYHFFFTHQSSGRGLVSRTANKEILEPVYDQILIQGNRIKAWLGNRMLVYTINDQHEITETLVVNNVVSVDKTSFFDAKLDFDSRLFQLGWFYDTKLYKDQRGNDVFRLAWGLKNDRDSLLAAPRYYNLKYVHNSPVVLQPTELSFKNYFNKEYALISNETGQILPNLRIVDLDTTDFLVRNFARFIDPIGLSGVLRKDGTYDHFPYVDRGTNRFLRVCVSGIMKHVDVFKDTLNTLRTINGDLNSVNPFAGRVVDKKNYQYHTISKSLWNFLNDDGELMFKENFLYAEPFEGNHAIVRTQTGFGVVDSSGFVIEPIYRKIKREYIYGDTLFLVETLADGAELFELQGKTVKPLNISNVVVQKNRKAITVLASAYQRHVVHDEMGLIRDSLSNVKLFNDGFFAVKKQKIYHLHNAEGDEIGTSNIKPKNFINDQVFYAADKVKLKLFDIQGQSLSDAIYSNFEINGSYLFGYQSAGVDVYDTLGSKLLTACQWVMHDPISGKIAFRKDDAVYFSGSKKAIKLKLLLNPSPITFFNDKLYFKDQVFSSDCASVKRDYEPFYRLDYLGDGFFTVERFNKPLQLLHLEHGIIEIPGKKMRKPKLHSSEIIEFQCDMKTYLYNMNSQKLVEVEETIETFSEGLICVRLSAEHYVYLNEDLENAMDHIYLQAKPFRGGIAAVKYTSGWTIIDSKGNTILVPCYPDISVLSSEILLILPKSRLGLFDKNGREIVPVTKDVIHLAEDHIRTQEFGKIDYQVFKGVTEVSE